MKVIEYRVKYGHDLQETHHDQHMHSDETHDNLSYKRGGVGTSIRGIVHFTSAAESHKGLCHGGGMCSVFDDVIGWTAFCVSGKCVPWSGYTVEVNTRLMKPVPLGAWLEISCTVTKVDRRKVYLHATLANHKASNDGGSIYASADGLVILNKVHLE